MRAQACLAVVLLLAGCSDSADAPPPAAPEAPAEAPQERTGREPESLYTCQGSQGAAVGAGGAFVAGVMASFCPAVKLEAGSEPFRSGRLTMEWSQPAPTLVDAYVQLVDGGEVVAEGESDSSPVVVEFTMDPTDSFSGEVWYGGTGVGAAFEVTITVEMFSSETPPDPHRPTAAP